MNDQFLNTFDEKEIEKIQEEIQTDLMNSGYKDAKAQNDAPAHAAEATGCETATPVYAAPTQPTAAAPAPAVHSYTPAHESVVYTETIKRHKPHKRSFLRVIAAAVIIAVIGGPLAGFCVGFGSKYAESLFIKQETTEEQSNFSFPTLMTSDTETATISVAPNLSSIIDDFSAIVDVVEPSVVAITSVSDIGGESSFFRQSIEMPSEGSGIIFDQDDENIYVVTNYHVVSGANRVGVSVSGSELAPAALVGAERGADIAVISVSKKELASLGISNVTVAKFGSSDEMKVGEIVLAIGNALGEGNTATLGIISAKNKEITVDGLRLTVMQTDAAINPGNSGGPLINTKGEVIAINVAKTLYGVEGTGYSLPMSEAIPIIEDLRNRKVKPFIGINMANLDEETAAMYNLPAGVLIRDIYEKSPAEKAGLRRNDVITGFNGNPIFTYEDLQNYLYELEIGDEVEIRLYRIPDGALTMPLTLGEQPLTDRF